LDHRRLGDQRDYQHLSVTCHTLPLLIKLIIKS